MCVTEREGEKEIEGGGGGSPVLEQQQDARECAEIANK